MRPFLAFDLGNVLLPFDHMKACNAVAHRHHLNASTVYDQIFVSGIEKQFDLGMVSPSQFTRCCAHALEINLHEDDFRDMWSDIFARDVEMETLVRQLLTRP